MRLVHADHDKKWPLFSGVAFGYTLMLFYFDFKLRKKIGLFNV